MKRCKGASYLSRAVSRLKEGRHPDKGTMLSTLPRRITRRDVGLDIWNDDQLPSVDSLCESSDTVLACDEHHAVDMEQHDWCVPLPIQQLDGYHGEEEDPLGHGCCLD